MGTNGINVVNECFGEWIIWGFKQGTVFSDIYYWQRSKSARVCSLSRVARTPNRVGHVGCRDSQLWKTATDRALPRPTKKKIQRRTSRRLPSHHRFFSSSQSSWPWHRRRTTLTMARRQRSFCVWMRKNGRSGGSWHFQFLPTQRNSSDERTPPPPPQSRKRSLSQRDIFYPRCHLFLVNVPVSHYHRQAK